MKTILALITLIALTIPALADRFECYPIYQTGGGDTRRIVINLTFSSRNGEVTDFGITHQLGSGGSRDRSIQYDDFYWQGTRTITWSGSRYNDNGDRVNAMGTFSYSSREYTETLTVRGKGVVARIRSTCSRF
jgi:hypothetical protein